MNAIRELGSKLLDVATAADELTRRTDGLLRGKQISGPHASHVVHYANYG